MPRGAYARSRILRQAGFEIIEAERVLKALRAVARKASSCPPRCPFARHERTRGLPAY